MSHAEEKKRPEPLFTLEQFRATGRDVEDVGAVVGWDPDLDGLPGRVYLEDTLYVVRDGDKWRTVLENKAELVYSHLEDLELVLYRYARASGAIQ